MSKKETLITIEVGDGLMYFQMGKYRSEVPLETTHFDTLVTGHMQSIHKYIMGVRLSELDKGGKR